MTPHNALPTFYRIKLIKCKIKKVKTSLPAADNCSMNIRLPFWRFVKPDLTLKLHLNRIIDKENFRKPPRKHSANRKMPKLGHHKLHRQGNGTNHPSQAREVTRRGTGRLGEREK